MRLQDQLAQRKAHFESGASADVLQVMHKATQNIIASDILSGIPEEGDQAPLFTLPSADGSEISLEALLKRGPVVLHFFRGGW